MLSPRRRPLIKQKLILSPTRDKYDDAHKSQGEQVIVMVDST